MGDDEDDPNHLDSIRSQSTVEQQNNAKTISTTDTTFTKEKEKLTSNRRRVRVKFAYSFDNDRVLPITQTTVIKTEPCFKIIATEDPITKQFYRNKSKKHESIPLIEPDSLDEEYPPLVAKKKEVSSKIFDVKQSVPHRTSSSIPLKSILKKSKKKEETSIPSLHRPLKSQAPSLKKRERFSTRLDFNEVQHLAEITAKQNLTSPSIHCRSLFDQTINIFNPNHSYRITSNSPRPSRLQYYIKPYRGDPQVPVNMIKERSRSLSQQSERTPRRPFTRQSNKKQHVSWSSARDHIYQRSDGAIMTPTKKERISSGETTSSSSLTVDHSLSFNNPSLQNLPPIIPISIRHRLSQFPPPSSSSTDSYYTPSIVDRPLISLTSEPQHHDNREKEKTMLRSHLSDQHRKEHNETMKRYDRLLEKLRRTDGELQSLSRSWMNSTQQRTSVEVDRRSNLTLNKMPNKSDLFSPMIIQICLIILVIFNLLIVYFFNEINLWWSENIAPGMIVERHNEAISNF